MTETVEYARSYNAAGITVAPLAPWTKVPIRGDATSAYRTKPQRAEDLPGIFNRPGMNIAALTGSCSNLLTVLDFDDHRGWTAADSVSVFRRMKAIAPVVRTRRGFHVWLFAPWPLRSTKCPHFRADIQAEGRYVVAPPSEVRKEGTPQLYLFVQGGCRPPYRPSPEEWAELADLFSLQPIRTESTARDAPEDFETTALFYGLGAASYAALRCPAEPGRRSEAEQGVIYRAACIGWSLGDVEALFRKEAAPGTKFGDKLKAGHARAWLEAGYRAALATAAERMSPGDRAINETLDALAGGMNPFSGRGAWSELAAFRTVLQVRRETGRPWIGGSLRYMAERAGLDHKRFMGALDRLEEAGALQLLRVQGSVFMAEAPDYVSELRAKCPISSHSLGSGYGALQGGGAPAKIVNASHDAYRAGALGKAGPELVRRLNSRTGAPWSIVDLVGAGLGLRYLRRAVSLLERSGIITRAGYRKHSGAGRSAVLYHCPHGLRFSDLDAVAAEAGTQGMGDRQRARHAEERRSSMLKTGRKLRETAGF